MQAAEYFDSIAQFWDMEYSDNELAREITASISIPRGGGYTLDIGCGSGGMILDLLRYGAYEVEGVDFSPAMAEMAREKFSFDPRVSIETIDFFALEHAGYDLAVAFNTYQYFRHPGAFIAKAYSLLREDGRLTVACGFSRKRTNALSETLPKGIARPLRSAAEEAKDWAPFFKIDCICDTDDLYLISGRAVAGIGGKL